MTTKNAPPTEPILRIETEMHTAVIRRIGLDRDNRYLVTASDDKTARVWELASGRLLRVLRPPLGEGYEGKLNAAAMSPDGRTVAVSGWTKAETESHNIYLFDRKSGRLLRRITGLPNVILHLTYSPDGNRLAATLYGQNGLRVYETSNYSQLFADTDYGNDSYWVDFDSAGRLVTSCFDGFMRLYEPTADERTLRLVTKRKVEGGNQPFSVHFSPDGRKIAVGFYQATKVAVVSGDDLSLLFTPDTSDVSNGGLFSVSWSTDGSTLFAGGIYASGGQRQIRYWSEGGRGKWRDVATARSTILHILPLRDGGVIFGTSDPAFGRIDVNGNRTLLVTAAIARYSEILAKFLLSSDGTRLQFGYETVGKAPARFALVDRQLLTNLTSNPTDDLMPPITAGIAVTDWKNTTTPKINGEVIKLKQHEPSRSLAIAPDKSRFLLGTEWSLRLFDSNGKELWQVAAPSAAWSVNISGDGRLAVAAFGDGTIRWYRITDGKELLAFFPHNDRKRWVLWTPSGYYDASPGAEGLIGWHLNNGADKEAYFFPASRFRATAYRPDIVTKILTTLDEDEAVRQANEETNRKAQQINIMRELPPIVEILSPGDGTEVTDIHITVRFRLHTPSGEPVTGIKIFIDGRPVETERGLGAPQTGHSPNVREAQITIPERDSEIAVIAENRFSVSEPATRQVKWRGHVAQYIIKPRLYALAIGVNNYASGELQNLKFSAKDAEDFAAALLRQKGGLYLDVDIRLLVNEGATKDEILGGFDWLERETTSKDVAVVFLSGHGINDRTGRYFYLPQNADLDSPRKTAVLFSDIKNTVETLPGKALFFIDTCHAGNVMGTRKGTMPDIMGLVNELSSAENGAVVFASSTGKQISLEDASWGNGAFTKALVEGLDGEADLMKQGKITVNMLDSYVSERVKTLTKGRQTPTTTKPKTIADFPIAVRITG
jgi:WD40 repeat protein